MVTRRLIRITQAEKAAAADLRRDVKKLERKGAVGNDSHENNTAVADKENQRQKATDGRGNNDIDDGGKSVAVDNHNTSNKRPLPLDSVGDTSEKKHRKKKQKFIDLSDVPEQLPILKSNGKSGSSKYQGVTFNKASKKWQVLVRIDGKQHHIGRYDNEEDAAKDYARAVHKYREGKAAVERQRQKRPKVIDLSDVPEQLPILKSNGKTGSSKYQGVTFNKARMKWHAQIVIDGKVRTIGYYDDEEEAAKDYARAVFKHRGGKAAIERQRQKKQNLMIDLSDVPEQLPVLSNRKGASSKYQGVSFHEAKKKWHARIEIGGKRHHIGNYDNEEEAAKDYARAVHKYWGGNSAVERQQQKKQNLMIDLSDVSEQLPILSNRKNGSSKYQGVSFDKARKKWKAQIMIDGKYHHIGLYDNEEEAAKDYSCAVFKYLGVKAVVERQQQQQQKLRIDLSDIPEQLPILSNRENGSSKYQGVSFDKARKKWKAQIKIGGKSHSIGLYDNEEEAAKDYARAVYKCRGGIQQTEQLPILISNTKSSASKYQGISFNKVTEKWNAQMTIDGKLHHIGYYDSEEEAAKAYARAAAKEYARTAFKHQGGKSAVDCEQQKIG